MFCLSLYISMENLAEGIGCRNTASLPLFFFCGQACPDRLVRKQKVNLGIQTSLLGCLKAVNTHWSKTPLNFTQWINMFWWNATLYVKQWGKLIFILYKIYVVCSANSLCNALQYERRQYSQNSAIRDILNVSHVTCQDCTIVAQCQAFQHIANNSQLERLLGMASKPIKGSTCDYPTKNDLSCPQNKADMWKLNSIYYLGCINNIMVKIMHLCPNLWE